MAEKSDQKLVNEEKNSSGVGSKSPLTALKCSCWFNKRGKLIYREDACPLHGKDSYAKV